MDAVFAAKRMNEDSVSMWTKSASRETQDLVSTTSGLIFTSRWRERSSSVASRTADNQSNTKSSEIPRHTQTMKINHDTSPVDIPSVTADQLQLDSVGKMSVGELRISSAKNIILPVEVRSPINQLTSQTTVKRDTADSALLLNTRNITTNVPPRGEDIVMNSTQPLNLSQVHITEDTQKTLLLHDSVVTRDIVHDSTSYKLTVTPQLSVSAALKSVSRAAAKVQTPSQESANGQLLSSLFQSTTAQETSLQSPVSPTSSIRDTLGQNISLPSGAESQFTSQRNDNSSLLLNLRNVTNENSQKTSVLADDTVTTDSGHNDTYEPTVNHQLSEVHQLSVTAVIQTVPAVTEKIQTQSHKSTAEVAGARFSLSQLQSTAAPETTSQFSLPPTSGIKDTSARSISFRLGTIGRVTPQRTVITEVENEAENSLLRNSWGITTNTPLSRVTVTQSQQSLRDSQTHVSEDVQKTSIFPGVFQKLSTVATKVQTLSSESAEEVAGGQFSSSLPQFIAAEETTSHASVAPTSSAGDVAETFHSGFHMNGTNGVMQTPVNSSNNVAFTTAISVGVLFGILVTFVAIVGIVILRRRRKTDSLQTTFACVQKEKSLFPSKTCAVGMDYTEIEKPALRHGSVHKFDEVFLLPHEQMVHNASGDSCDKGSIFDELDWLVHIDTDMSSLLHVVDGQLAENCRRSSASNDAAGDSWVETEQFGGRDSATISESPYHLPCDLIRNSDDDVAVHEYDSVYIPHDDAAGMARRIDSETSYVKTLRSRQNFSPYEEVCYGIRPLLLFDRQPAPVQQQNPILPPRTSSVADSHLQDSGSSE